jgi:hypothetical protein
MSMRGGDPPGMLMNTGLLHLECNMSKFMTLSMQSASKWLLSTTGSDQRLYFDTLPRAQS